MDKGASILCPNNWKISRSLLFVLVIQAGLIVSLFAPPIPLLTPLAKLVLGFLCLTIIPGVLILRILRLHEFGVTRNIIYVVTLSLAFDMFLGLIVNSVLPAIGIARPLDVLPLAIVFGITILLLSLTAYLRDGRYGLPVTLQFDTALAWRAAFFLTLPLFAILGAELVNFRNNNSLLLILIPVLAAVPLLILSSRLVPEKLYPLVIVSVSLSLLLHLSLISSSIVGRDIMLEYRIFQVADEQSRWISNYPYHGYNATLSVTVLPLVISRLTGLDGSDVLRIVAPVLFSLTPLVVYEVVKRFLDSKVAALSAFLQMYLYQFYIVMPQTVKNEIGWLFISTMLMTLLIRDKTTGDRILILLLAIAGIFSHYYSAYLAIYLFLAGVVLQYLWSRGKELSLAPIAMFAVVVTIGWYMYTGSGADFKVLADMINDFIQGLASGFSSSTGAYALNLVGRQELSPARFVLKYQYLFLYFLFLVGFGIYFLRWLLRKRVEFSRDYMVFSVAAVGLLVGAALPGVAAVTDINRSFSLNMIFLSSFSIIGVFTLSIIFCNVIRVKQEGPLKKILLGESTRSFWEPSTHVRNLALTLSSLFIGSFLLFGSGWVSEIEKDEYPISWALSRERIQYSVFYDAELDGTRWLVDHRSKDKNIYYDNSAEISFLYYSPLSEFQWGIYALGDQFALYYESDEGFGSRPVATPADLEPASYIYLRKLNLESKKLAVLTIAHKLLTVPRVMPLEDLPAFEQTISNANIVFDNGYSQVRLMR
ncbi:MAG: DUF2206 domain-containing protein [Chloroflexi bacterium]|nr:DUF2206 domain-containing protein [Chloroflexota bacterium]